MAQEVTVIVKVDVEAALQSESLEGNIYFIDNLRTAGSAGVGTAKLTSMAKGFYWMNGAQATDLLFNWLMTSIASMPITVPKGIHARNAHKANANVLKKFVDLNERKEESVTPALIDKLKKHVNELHTIPKRAHGDGSTRADIHPLVNLHGQPFNKEEELSHLSYLTPILTGITGEAVEKGVMYPAQYGTPVAINDGWYWSASIATNLAGTYAYTLHILLHRLINKGDEYIWEPVELTHDAYVQVVSEPKKNGFTGNAVGVLPL